MPAQVQKGTGRAVAKGHTGYGDNGGSTRRASVRRTSRSSGRK